MRFFGQNAGPASGQVAKDRLRNVLDAEHNGMTRDDLEALRRDLSKVLDSYFVLDDAPVRVSMTRQRQKNGAYLRCVRIEAQTQAVRRMALRP